MFCLVFRFLGSFLSCFFPCHLVSLKSPVFFHSCTPSLIPSPQYLVSRFPSLIAESSPHVPWSKSCLSGQVLPLGLSQSCLCFIATVMFCFSTVLSFWYPAQPRPLFLFCLLLINQVCFEVLHLGPPFYTTPLDNLEAVLSMPCSLPLYGYTRISSDLNSVRSLTDFNQTVISE